MVSCVHHVPERARFRLPALRHDDGLVEQIRSEVAVFPGVFAVEINRHAASIVVHYCTQRCEIDFIMERICIHCPQAAANRNLAPQETGTPAAPNVTRPRPRISPRVTSAMGEAVSKALVNTRINRAVERGLSSVLIGLR